MQKWNYLHQILLPDGWQRARSCCESLQLNQHSPPFLSFRTRGGEDHKTAERSFEKKKKKERKNTVPPQPDLVTQPHQNGAAILKGNSASQSVSLSGGNWEELPHLPGWLAIVREREREREREGEGNKLYGGWRKLSLSRGKNTTTDTPLSLSLPLIILCFLPQAKQQEINELVSFQ